MKPNTIELAKAYLEASNAGNDAERHAIAKQILELQQAKTPENAEFFGAIAKAADCTKEADADELFRKVNFRKVVVEDQSALGPFQGESWTVGADIPNRNWLIENMLPAGRLVSLYGEGAIGKSFLAMQVAAAIMHGGWPIALDPELDRQAASGALADIERAAPKQCPDPKGKVLWLTWEDETAEFRRRWRMAFQAGAIGRRAKEEVIGFDADPELLTLVNMRRPGIGGPLWAPDNRAGSGHISSRATWTDAGKRFLESMEGHVLAVIDPLAAAFGSNENDRGLVRQFTAAADGHAETTGCTVLLIGHPPKSQDSGGYSGSTDWRNSVRASWHLEKSDETGHVICDGNKAPKAKAYRLTNDKASYTADSKHVWLRRYYKKGKSGKLGKLAWFATTAGKAAKAIDPRAQRKDNGGDTDESNPYGKGK